VPVHLPDAAEQAVIVGNVALQAADRLALRQDIEERRLAGAAGPCEKEGVEEEGV
jgi:hypothetical protein